MSYYVSLSSKPLFFGSSVAFSLTHTPLSLSSKLQYSAGSVPGTGIRVEENSGVLMEVK